MHENSLISSFSSPSDSLLSNTVQTVKKELSFNKCTFCGLHINDQYIYKITPDLQSHEKCIKCAECNEYFEENSKCFIKNNKAYCKDDYLRLFALKCVRCNVAFKTNDMIMKCKSDIYHYNCFYCDICKKKFLPGDEFSIERKNLLLCKDDSFNNEFIIKQQQTLSINVNNNNNFKTSVKNDNAIIMTATIVNNTNSDDSSYSPSINSSSSIESPSTISINNNQFHIYSSNNTNYESIYSPVPLNYNITSVIDNGSSDYNCQLIKNEYNSESDDNDDGDSSSEKDLKISFNKQLSKHNQQSQHYSSSSSSSSVSNSISYHSSNSSTKPARIRTVLNEKQLHTLRACYGANPRPDALMKEQLVEMTGLSPRVIRVWFQNKRCKDKKKILMNGHGDPNHQSRQQHIIFDHCF